MSTDTAIPALVRIPAAAFLVYEREPRGAEHRYGAETAEGARDLAARIQAEHPLSYVTWWPTIRAGGAA